MQALLGRHCDLPRTGHLDRFRPGAASIESAQEYLNLVDPLDDTAPAPVKAAILLMAAGLYSNREDVSDRQLYANETYYRLLAPYRVFS